jgi:hypothetical protein
MNKLILLVLLFGYTFDLKAQVLKTSSGNFTPPVTFTTEQDHQNMMQQLGIKTLRPGPSGDENAPNHANYDETLANPCPQLPEILTTKNGEKVTTAEMWWNKRRPEIVEDFEREVYGRLPKNIPAVNWKVEITDYEFVGWTPVVAKKITGQVDNSLYPLINVNIDMMLVVPLNVKGPVPVLMMFGRPSFPSPAQPSQENMDKINKAFKDLLIKENPELKAVFEQYPGIQSVETRQPVRDEPTAG